MAPGDDIRMYGGQYYYDTPQRISKAGTRTNRIDIRPVANTGVVQIDASNFTQWEPVLLVQKNHVTVAGIEIRNNPQGGGINVWGSDVTISGCKVYNNGDYAIGIAGYRGVGASWDELPDNVTVKDCTAYANVRVNDPSYKWYVPDFRRNNGGWAAALNGFGVENVRFQNCTSYENFGEGIMLSRVRGGDSEISECTVRDNWSVNIYLDSAQGTSSNFIHVFDNDVTSQWVTKFWRNGNPAHGIVVSSESYNDGLSNQKSRFIAVFDNEVKNGLHNFRVSNFGGLGVSEVWFGRNRSGYAQPGPEVIKTENGSTITSIWSDNRNTYSNGSNW